MPSPETGHEDDAGRSARRRAAVSVDLPEGTSLSEATVALTRELGSPDPEVRDRVALPTLLAWVSNGVHDELLSAVGDGMTAGLALNQGRATAHGTATSAQGGTSAHLGSLASGASGQDHTAENSPVLRRAGSAQVLATVVRRDNERHLVHQDTVLRWADAVFTWIVREPDTHTVPLLPGPGPVGHGADVLAALADSRHLDEIGLTVLLDVVADRVLAATDRLPAADLDLLARAAVHAVSRDVLTVRVLEPWALRLAHGARARRRATRADAGARQNAQDLLRAMHLRLVLGAERPAARADLLLVLAEAIRSTAVDLFEA